LAQPEKSVPVTTYCVVTAGVAMGFAAEALFNVPAGDQLYTAAPEADNWLCEEMQSRSFDLEALTNGNGSTVTTVDNTDVLLHNVSIMETE
jgi:hypothetical protein